jgi:hypothetical protein
VEAAGVGSSRRRETAAGIEEELSQLGTRVDIAEQSAVADVTKDRRTFVDAVEAELLRWDVYLERLQVKAATAAGSTREQAEAAISELRRHRNALGERLGEVRSGGGGIPVIADPAGERRGVEAVIDKDLTAGLLARELAVDALLLLPMWTRSSMASDSPPPGRSGRRPPLNSAQASAGRAGQEHVTMTAAQPESSVTEGVRTLEVRWIFPGELETAVDGWFGRFTAGAESREDSYLLNPHLPGLSVKVREGGALEVKVYRGSPGILDVAGRARGHMESWQKWSFPCGQPSQGSGEVVGWRPVHKRRRIGWFSLASEPVLARVPALGGEPGCAVELTEVRARGEDWWSMGFEATGPADLLRGELEATAALVFAEALPGGVAFGTDDSRSYAEWLWRRPGGESGKP